MKVAKSFVVISDGASRYGGVQIRRHRNLHGGCDWIARSTPTSTLAIPMRPVPVDLKPEIGRRFTTLPRDLSDICCGQQNHERYLKSEEIFLRRNKINNQFLALSCVWQEGRKIEREKVQNI